MSISTLRQFGRLIREHRQRQGLTQQRLAKGIGCSHKWIVDLEGGRAEKLSLALTALNLLGVSFVEPPVEDRRPSAGARKPLATANAPEHQYVHMAHTEGVLLDLKSRGHLKANDSRRKKRNAPKLALQMEIAEDYRSHRSRMTENEFAVSRCLNGIHAKTWKTINRKVSATTIRRALRTHRG